MPPLHNVEWRIALPADTLRQRVRHVEAIGHPFTEEVQDGQRVAVFKFDELTPHQGGLVGWKAVIEMYSIKYTLSPADVEEVPPLSEEFQQRYLVDDDDLAMDTETIREAAKAASGSETNILRKMLKIRNYVYDRLSYGIQPKIDTPDIALERGIGSCGEYVGVLLALTRLNGIACRTIGRYKCPPYPEQRNLPLEPDFNHVWLEFYVPGIGWLPMESNVDDVIDRGPYPTRFFMGLAWYHTELGKGIPFAKLKADDKPEKMSLGDLAINHIRFTILDELRPGADKQTLIYVLFSDDSRGAGALEDLKYEASEAEFKASVTAILEQGRQRLEAGAAALDVVEYCVNLLEDNPLYNAGKGSVLNENGQVEMDAALMEGKDLKAGAIACIKNIKNPISLARLVLDKSSHVMLVAEGAMEFAKFCKVEPYPDDYFITESRINQLKEAQAAGVMMLDHEKIKPAQKLGHGRRGRSGQSR